MRSARCLPAAREFEIWNGEEKKFWVLRSELQQAVSAKPPYRIDRLTACDAGHCDGDKALGRAEVLSGSVGIRRAYAEASKSVLRGSHGEVLVHCHIGGPVGGSGIFWMILRWQISTEKN